MATRGKRKRPERLSERTPKGDAIVCSQRKRNFERRAEMTRPVHKNGNNWLTRCILRSRSRLIQLSAFAWLMHFLGSPKQIENWGWHFCQPLFSSTLQESLLWCIVQGEHVFFGYLLAVSKFPTGSWKVYSLRLLAFCQALLRKVSCPYQQENFRRNSSSVYRCVFLYHHNFYSLCCLNLYTDLSCHAKCHILWWLFYRRY